MNLSKAEEIKFTTILNLINDNIKSLYKDDRFSYTLSGDDNSGRSNVEIIYNPDSEFEYFTMESINV